MPPTTPTSRSWKRFASEAALLGVGIAAALLLSELLVRRLAPQQHPLAVALRNLHAPDPELGYVMVPGFRRRVRGPEFECDLRTNSLGMRDAEPGPKVPGRLRVLGLGDSFVFGVHAGALENCFLKRLESSLRPQLAAHPVVDGRGRSWSDIEILDAGVDGYGTDQEVGWLTRLGARLQPDAVLLAFYLGNDFTDNSGRTRMTVVDGYQMLEASAAGYREHFSRPDRRLRLWLHAHSELYVFLKERILHPIRKQRAAGAAAPTVTAGHPFEYYIYDSGFADCLRAAASPQLETAMANTRAALLRLSNWCQENQAALLVVAIPAEQQVSAAARQSWLERFGLEAREFDFELPTRRLAALAAENGLPLFDLGPGFASRIAGGSDLHLHSDNHWNTAGHAAAAELLAEPVLEHLTGTAARAHASR
jgi:hypothetical protein